MTVTEDAPRIRASRRRPLRRLAVTGAIVAMLLGGAGAAAAATPDPAATATPGAAELTLVPAGNGVIRAGEDLVVSVALDNGTDATTSGSTVVLALGDQPLGDRAALHSWIAGESGGDSLREVGVAPLDPVSAGGSASVPVRIVGAAPALAGRAPGVYPLVATTTVDGALLTSTSAVVVRDDAPGPAVGVIAPILAPPIRSGLLDSDALLELTAADGSLTAQLDAVVGTPAILAVDPAIPAAIRVLGDAAPASAQAWLERLLALPNSRFALQFGDADLSSQIAAGLTQPLSPTTLVPYLRVGTVAPTSDPTPGVTAEPGDAGSVPDLAALTDIGATVPNVYWPLGGTAGAGVISALGALGTPETPAFTLVPSATTSAGANGARVDARVDAAASALLAYDSTVSDLLRTAADETDLTRRNAALTAATAHLALLDPGAPLLVSLDRGIDRSRSSMRAAIETAASAPGVAPVGLPQIVTGTATPVDVPEIPPDPARAAEVTALLADESAVARFATILENPALLTGRERAELLQVLGVGWRADAAAASQAFADHRADTVRTLDSVGILASDVINLLSYDSVYPPFVRNDLPWPISVTLVAQPDDPRLIVQTRTEVRAQADGNTRVEVPVQARIANGQVTVEMHLLSPSGEQIGAPQSVAVAVHAEWETIGLSILGVLLALFIGVGVVRTVLRRRAARRAPALEEGAE